MATTDAYGQGGLALAGSADTEFVHGPPVDSDIQVLWDFDGDGDFDGDVEDITEFVYEAEVLTGRDWPSQLQGKAGPGQLRLRVNNEDGRFSFFNADSPLNQDGNSLDPGRKIRVRARVQRGLDMPGGSGDTLSTPDAATLDVTTDLTIGADFDPDQLTGSIQTLVSKWTATGNQRSAMLQVTATRFPRLIHSPDGTLASQIITTSTVPLGSNRRQAVWVSIDVDNGAAGRTVRFYTADTIDGTPVLLDTVTTAGTTSIFSSTAPVLVGAHSTNSEQFTGVLYAAEWRAGLISSTDYRGRPDIRPLAVGTTSFTDVSGRTWTVNGACSVVDDPAPVDPVLLVRDRFDGTGTITTDEMGTPWEHQADTATFLRIDGVAGQFSAGGTSSLMVIDTGVADYYAQVTFAELGDNVLVNAGFQELNVNRLIYRWQDSSNYSYVSYGPFDNIGQHAISVVDVVAGAETTIVGPSGEIGGSTATGEEYAPGDHRRRVTVGVSVVGAAGTLYINGALRTTFTAIQTDETHVGLYVYYGLTNRAPAIDEIAVWDRVPTAVPGVIWTGRLLDVVPSSVPGGPREAVVTAEGSLAQLAGATINPSAYGGQAYSGVVIGDAIERAGLLYPPGELARGDMFAGSSSDAEITALAHCRKLEEVEFGFLHEAPEGWLVFRDRSYREDLEVSATFTDDPDDQYGFQSFELLPWRRELVNRVTAGVSYGPPNIIAISGSQAGTATSTPRSVVATLPASVQDGDLFVLIIVSTVDSNSEDWLVPIFWVRNRDTGAPAGGSTRRTQVYTKIAAASEASTAYTFYNDAAGAGGSYVWKMYQVRDWFGSHEGIQIGPFAAGASLAGADPEPILPSWGDTNATMFVAQRGGTRLSGSGALSANATYPLGYVSGVGAFQGGVSGDDDDCAVQAATKLAMAAIEDADNFTGFTNLQNAETSVIAIRGRNAPDGGVVEARGRYRVTVDDADSQRLHGVITTYDGTDLFPTAEDAEEWGELLLTRYARVQPIVRISFTATASGGYRSQAAERRLGDKIHLTHSEEGINGDFHIENIRHRWSNGGKLWRVTWELSPAN